MWGSCTCSYKKNRQIQCEQRWKTFLSITLCDHGDGLKMTSKCNALSEYVPLTPTEMRDIDNVIPSQPDEINKYVRQKGTCALMMKPQGWRDARV